MPVQFNHPLYKLVDNDKIVRVTASAKNISNQENEEVSNELFRFIEAKIIEDYKFVNIPVPDSDDNNDAATSVLASGDWQQATKLLLIVQNAFGSQMGIFSRSLCFEEGISKGSMIPYIERAIAQGYSIIILRPNTNSISNYDPQSGKLLKRIQIIGSESPEIHALYVLENIIPQAENVKHIALLSYGNGAQLCKDILLRQIVRSKADGQSEVNRIHAFCAIEASKIIEEDDALDIKASIADMAVNLECSKAPKGYRLAYRREKLGCTSISLGLPPGKTEVENSSASIELAINMVFDYLVIAEHSTKASRTFAINSARTCGHDPVSAELKVNPNASENMTTQTVYTPMTTKTVSNEAAQPMKSSIFNVFKSSKPNIVAEVEEEQPKDLTIADFELLKVVGKGAFGKVMMVRKKRGVGVGRIYAMKVLKKSVIASLGQIEHTKAEQAILLSVRHPYVVCLRFSFQSDDKLFLVTDYYNGGSLYSHLRRSKFFTEERARFYAAELLSALDHLHTQQIIYRDLKLENILMDQKGHIALTDFGLSKQDIDKSGGATTFCGTAEYIAPELLNNQKYGKSVDWWSFGILLYEMMNGSTPFYDKNRKLMFYRIVNREPNYPVHFSPQACDCISKLLRKKEDDRLGSGPNGGKDIMKTDFFSKIDFDALFRKEIKPPFKPEVSNEFDTTYVPDSLLRVDAKESFADVGASGSGDNIQFDNFNFSGDPNHKA